MSEVSQAPGDLDGRQLLVVDDEPPCARALERALELEGYEVELAADGAEALDRVGRARRPTRSSSTC